MNSDEDLDLFREAVADARPVRASERVVPDRPKPKPVPIHSRRDEDAALAEALTGPDWLSDELDIGEAETYLRDGMPRKVLRDLARGRWASQAQLDLHGLRVEEARPALVLFIAEARRRGRRCVCVIHGKGLGSPGGAPVLRQRVRSWLVQKDEVLAYCDAPPGQGGSGAVLILLKAS